MGTWNYSVRYSFHSIPDYLIALKCCRSFKLITAFCDTKELGNLSNCDTKDLENLSITILTTCIERLRVEEKNRAGDWLEGRKDRILKMFLSNPCP